MLPRLLALARAPVELAEAEVAVGDEGRYAQFAGQREGSLIGLFRRLDEALLGFDFPTGSLVAFLSGS